MKSFIRFFSLSVWIFSACTPTLLATQNIPQDNLPVLISTLEPRRDYIIYESRKSGESEIWAVHPKSGNRLLITKENVQSNGWSPSGDYWLFEDSDSLYVAKADGSYIQRVYQLQEIGNCGGEAALWLSDDVILIDVYSCDERGRFWPPPHQYYLNIKTGANDRLDPVNEYDDYGTYLIQGVIPNDESWIQLNWYTGEVEIADLEGNHNQIIDELNLNTEVGALSMEFVPGTKDVIFQAWRDDASKPDNMLNGLWKMSLSNKLPELIIEGMPDKSIREYSVSPDGRFLAYAYEKGFQYIIAFYNIQNEEIEYEWEFPYRLTFPRFIWSPTARFIALPYSTYDYPDATTDGIQVMDIFTGKTRM